MTGRQSACFFAFVVNRLMSKEGFLRTAMTLSAWDVGVSFPTMAEKTGRDISNVSDRV